MQEVCVTRERVVDSSDKGKSIDRIAARQWIHVLSALLELGKFTAERQTRNVVDNVKERNACTRKVGDLIGKPDIMRRGGCWVVCCFVRCAIFEEEDEGVDDVWDAMQAAEDDSEDEENSGRRKDKKSRNT